ncbi:MAG: adenylate/guanylate cyclase domain-containing protein [Nitrososphaeraceae archaeon]|jgi:adenylate cyclase|nr:adenylate/guanylate cyclase domain-containing protein [Nitrososphaeraceae archaeon]
MGEDKDKENEIHERNVSYNTKRKSDKIKEEISIDIENNNQEEEEEDTKEKIIDRMVDRNYNTSNKTEQSTKQNSVLPSTENRTIYDLQTLLSQRQDRLESVLYERYKYNTSIKRGQDFLLNHVDSKLSLVVMYADLVGSTKMSMALPVERMAKIIKVFSHELSSVVESYNGFVLKYVGDAVIACFPSGFNKYLSCDTAFQCAKSMINIIENGINPIFEKDKDNYPKLAVKIGIDEGENLAIQYGYDKSAPIDLIGYPMNVAAKMTSLTGPNKITVGNNVYKLLHPSLQPEFQEMQMKEGTEWKYIDLETNLPYKVYTMK